MSGYKHLPIPDMEHWTPEQVLAIYDLCQTISAALMARHEDQLVELMMAIEQHCETNSLDIDMEEKQFTLFK